MKSMCSLAGVLLLANVYAEMKQNPDPNTLWCEDGKEIVTGTGNSDKAWNNSLNYAALPDGKGFSVEFIRKPTGGRYLKVSEEYPWFVYEISSVELKKGYCQNSMSFQRVPSHGQMGKIFPGIYAFHLYENSQLPKQGLPFLRIDQHGSKLTYRYLKMVKKPENFIQCESEAFQKKKSFADGDKIKITVTLQKPAEDVSLSFFKNYTMPEIKLGGASKLQLKPLDKEGKIWSGELTVAPQNGALRPNDVWIRADITGGEVALPLWTAIPFEYKK